MTTRARRTEPTDFISLTVESLLALQDLDVMGNLNVDGTATIRTSQEVLGSLTLDVANAGDQALIVQVGNTSRYRVLGDGAMEWSPDGVAFDTRLERVAANVLGLAAGDSLRLPTDGQLQWATNFNVFRNADRFLAIQPVAANTGDMILAIVPKGTLAGFAGIGNIAIYATDVVADPTNFEQLLLTGNKDNRYRIDVRQGGTGSLRPLHIEMQGNSAIEIATDRAVTIPVSLSVPTILTASSDLTLNPAANTIVGTAGAKMSIGGNGFPSGLGADHTTLVLNGNRTRFFYREADQVVDERFWEQRVDGKQLIFLTINDTLSSGTNWLIVNRGTGVAIDLIEFPASLTPVRFAGAVQANGGVTTSTGDLTFNPANNIVISGGKYMELGEMADPAAPAADRARLYVRDNGAGKTQLVVRFNTGAVQVIATEP